MTERRVFFLGVIVLAVLLLAGCMAELQTGEPVLRPTLPATVTAPASTATNADAGPTPTGPTVIAAAESAQQNAQFAAPPADATSTAVIAEAPAAPSEVTPPIVPILPVLSNEERWRTQQQQREVFGSIEQYTTSGSDLYWYDPINQQHVVLGRFVGPFDAQARFVLSSSGQAALEVPYQINQRYGLTAISPRVVDRMRAAGYTDWVETYVLIEPGVQPR